MGLGAARRKATLAFATWGCAGAICDPGLSLFNGLRRHSGSLSDRRSSPPLEREALVRAISGTTPGVVKRSTIRGPGSAKPSLALCERPVVATFGERWTSDLCV